MLGIQFYPTPKEIAYKLISKLDLDRVNYILEPSAGKGDFLSAFWDYKSTETLHYVLQDYSVRGWTIVDSWNANEVVAGLSESFKRSFSNLDEAKTFLKTILLDDGDERYSLSATETAATKKLVEVQCVEIDANLCSILRESKHHYLCDNADFLDWCSFTRYDTVLMNPPFANGDKHLLKAIKLLSNGGQICCILNAETLKNPYTTTRQELLRTLQEYHADIEYVENGFSDAERQTDVEVALIYVDIPQTSITQEVAVNFVKGDVYEDNYTEYQNQVYAGNAITLMVEQFQLEARYGLKLIDTFNQMKQYIPTTSTDTEHRMINLVVSSIGEEHSQERSPSNTFIRALREKYWTNVFQTNEIRNLMTEAAAAKYQAQIRKFRDYDFTLSNIKALQIELSNNLNQNVEEAIVDLYDRFTYKHSMDNDKNVHMFNGWKTNSGFKINPKKIIYPLYCYTNYRSYGSWDFWKVRDFLTEVEKVMVYLDGGKTEGSNVVEILNNYKGLDLHNSYDGRKIEFKYFDVELKKKQTIHIFWKCPELIKKLTIIGCKHHGALPNDYGTRDYKTASDEYKQTVDAFEGEKDYADTHNNVEFYSTSKILMLGVGE